MSQIHGGRKNQKTKKKKKHTRGKGSPTPREGDKNFETVEKFRGRKRGTQRKEKFPTEKEMGQRTP